MKLQDRVRDITEFVLFLLILGAIHARAFTWPIVVGLIAVLAIHYLKNAIPDRRTPKVDSEMVLAIQEQIRRIQGNVSNLNMIVGIKGAPPAPEPQKPPTT